jgi:hypothetical protein
MNETVSMAIAFRCMGKGAKHQSNGFMTLKLEYTCMTKRKKYEKNLTLNNPKGGIRKRQFIDL